MAQGYDFDYSVTEEQVAHFNRLREDRGWSWETLADNLAQQTTDPASEHLVAWARKQAKDNSARGKKAGTEKR